MNHHSAVDRMLQVLCTVHSKEETKVIKRIPLDRNADLLRQYEMTMPYYWEREYKRVRMQRKKRTISLVLTVAILALAGVLVSSIHASSQAAFGSVINGVDRQPGK